MKKQRIFIVAAVLLGCCCMGVVDAVIQPGYLIKSIAKLALFMGTLTIYTAIFGDHPLRRMLRPQRRGILVALACGGAIYALILGAYLALKNVFDFSGIATSLASTAGVTGQNFLWVALYISFINSLLEEILFRGFAFMTLRRCWGRTAAYMFSAGAFAAYHIAMMIGWFELPVLLLALAGLFIGGLIFDRLDEHLDTIYLSWLPHMLANLAINTIGLMLLGT